MKDSRPSELKKLPVVQLDTRNDAELDGFETWHDFCRPVFDTKREKKSADYHTGVRFCEMEGLVFGETHYGAARFERSAAHLRGGEFDHLALHFVQRGQEVGSINGADTRISPDRVVLQDWAHPFARTSTEVHQLSVIIPRDRVQLSDVLYKRAPVHEWNIGSAGGRLLSHSLRAICGGMDEFSVQDSPKIANAFAALLNNLLESDLKGQPGSAEMGLPAIHEFLQRNLQRPSLGLEDVQRAFGLSRSSAYRLFQKEGGIHKFIQNERLAACYRELLKSESASKSIRWICERWGFRDLPHFYRSFRKRYGITPSEVREQAGHRADSRHSRLPKHSLSVATFHQWIGA
ncbi:MAG: helix-turn-helix domain-containing protein [Verrucomicrobiota bacterium]